MTKIIVMCDVDSTLIDFEAMCCSVAKSKGVEWPINCSWWVPPEQLKMTTEDFASMFRVVHSSEVFLKKNPYEDSVEVLNDLCNDFPNLVIFYVSHRDTNDNDTLLQWLKLNNFPWFDNAVSTLDKNLWIRLNSPDIVIDDRVRTMVNARFAHGVKFVYSLVQPWNINLKNNEVDGIYIRDSWRDLYSSLRATVDYLDQTKIKNGSE